MEKLSVFSQPTTHNPPRLTVVGQEVVRSFGSSGNGWLVAAAKGAAAARNASTAPGCFFVRVPTGEDHPAAIHFSSVHPAEGETP